MFRTLAALALLAVASPSFADDKDKPKPNTLTAKEIADGWLLLFDGETTFGWTHRSDEAGALDAKEGKLVVRGGDKGVIVQFDAIPFYYELQAEAEVEGEVIFATAFRSHKDKYLLAPAKGSSGFRLLSAPVGHPDNKLIHTLYWFDKENKVVGTEKLMSQACGKINGPNLTFTVPKSGRLTLRNVRLRPLDTKPLFTGKNLDGWKVNAADPKRMASKWEVTKAGELSVKDGPGDLVSEKEFDNFVLQFECKTNGKALNSGVFFRCIPGQYQNGYEAQIQNAYKDDDRTKPADFGTGAIYRRVPARKVVSNDNEWFTMTVVADGKHIATWVNGYQTVDWTDDRKDNDNPRTGYRAAKGPLSLQGHDPTTDILFRNIRIASP